MVFIKGISSMASLSTSVPVVTDVYRLDGKVALVTGASSGIGKAIATHYAARGADVVIAYQHNADAAEETATLVRGSGREAFVAQVDVSVPDDVERLFQALDNKFGRIDVLVNSAGIGAVTPTLDVTYADWARVLDVNLGGPFLCCQQAARRMVAQGHGGRIINITSGNEDACMPGMAAYNASKSGLRNLTRTLAMELGSDGITVNNIAPGLTLTPMSQYAIDNEAFRHSIEIQLPLQRLGLPSDIAQMAIFLASDAGAYCTGSTFFVDGGWMLTHPSLQV
jgi:glucose 1-dehydrogenase